MATELSIASFVAGRVRKRGRRFVLELKVYGGQSGELTGTKIFRARRVPALAARARKRLVAELRRARSRRAVPEAASAPPRRRETAEIEADAETAPQSGPERPAKMPFEPESESERAHHAETPDEPGALEAEAPLEAADEPSTALSSLELSAKLGLVTRDYAYLDEAADSDLREHSWQPTPAGRVRLRWYPGAHFGDGFWSQLGIEAHAELMLPIEATQGPSVFRTESRALGAGLRGRIPLGPSELGMYGGFGAHDVTIGNSQFGGDPEVPSAAYRLVRMGADARLALSAALRIEVRGSYLWTYGYGEITDVRWFPHASGGGVEAELGLSHALSTALWLEADVGFVRYFLNLDPEPDDFSVAVMRRVAAGAVDQQLWGTLGIALRLE